MRRPYPPSGRAIFPQWALVLARWRCRFFVLTMVAFWSLSATFVRAQWIEQFKIMGSDTMASDRFGDRNASISGNRILVGAQLNDAPFTNAGSAYLFDAESGDQLFKLTASDAAISDGFGISASISGNRAIIGASGDDDHGSSSGAAYVFDVVSGQQLFKLTASDAAPGELFGGRSAISGDLAIIAARVSPTAVGSAYLFDVTTGQELFKLTPSGGSAGLRFGISVAIDSNYAIVGADFDNDSRGAAFVFDTNTGQQLFKMTASDGAAGDAFGWSVALDGTTAVIGALQDKGAGSFLRIDL